MLQAITKYHVIYHGTLYPPGKPFPIAPEDEAEMRKHGTVEVETEPVPAQAETKRASPEPKRPGRARKTP